MLHPLELSVKENIEKHRLLHHDDTPVICTLSGGADSVALLAALSSLGYKCVAAHCNFHLRGAESMRDQLHARSVAEKLGVRFMLKDIDTVSYRKCHNASIEMACRELRYEWFYRLMSELRAQAIAVAHNYTDNIETMLLNQMRGTGIAGLGGMKWKNDSGVIRPMLDCRREQIEAYLHDKGLGHVTDSSNLGNDYRRNKIRHLVLPAVTAAIPSGLDGITRTMNLVGEQALLYRHLVHSHIIQCSDNFGGIVLDTLAAHPMAALMLYEWGKDRGMSRQQADDIIASRKESGKTFRCRDTEFFNDHGTLRERVNREGNGTEFPFAVTIHDINEFHPSRLGDEAYFDAEILNHGKLGWRYWQPGDRMAPYGMNGSRKLSDIFSDAKISIDSKHRIPLLTLGEQILWIAGVRASRLYRITPDTKRFIMVRLK